MELFIVLARQIFVPIVSVVAVLLLINFEITMIVEVIKNHELSRIQKLLWSLAIVVIQPIGVIAYLAAARFFKYEELRYV